MSKVQLLLSHDFAKERKNIGEETSADRVFLPDDSLLPSCPIPRASLLSTSAFVLAFTKTTTTSSSGGGGGGGGGGFDRLNNGDLNSDMM